MDFLKQNNFRYTVIIIIIILAVINLYKINSQENFMILTEEQDLGTHNVKINSTDQVIFGDKTLTHKLTNIESGVLTLGTDNNGSTSIVDGKNDLHLKSNKDVLLMSPSENATVVSKQQGNSGKLVVEGRADFKAGVFAESSGDTGSPISIINKDKIDNKQAQNWSIMNFNNYNNSNGLAFWRYSKLGCTGGGMCNQHMILNDDGSTDFDGVVRSKYFNLRDWGILDGGRVHIQSTVDNIYLMAKKNVIILKSEEWNSTGDLIVDGTLTVGTLTVGSLTVKSEFYNYSDKRLKENIKNISQNDKDKVLQLVPKTYNMISDQNKKRYGLIAQEVEELYPELVDTNKTDGMKSINYIELIPLLLEQIKELKKTIPNQNVINIGGVTLNSNELIKLKNMINNNTI